MIRLACLLLALLTCATMAAAQAGLDDHDLSRWASQPFRIETSDGTRNGTLWQPQGTPRASVVLVHGDGPQDRLSGGGYVPLINALLEAGITVASWDKPGIGASDGDWRDQSMEDRARDVRAALAALPTGPKRGALGFSQAGWVLPKLRAPDADFLVLIGPAISWQEQGAYYSSRRGASGPGPALTPERRAFVERNRNADATSDLAALNIPLLAIWGERDLNVDAAQDAATYRALLGSCGDILIWPDATHGLLRAGPYNYQLLSDWPWHAKARFIWAGRAAYAPGVLDHITDWIVAR